MNVELTVITPERTPEIPDESWSIDRLATFCGLVGRRHAEDAWLIGKAFAVVKAKLEHGKWLPWVNKHCPGLSRGTANRYMLLAERCTLDEVRGHGLTECYRRVGMVTTPAARVDVEHPTTTAAVASQADEDRVRQKPATSASGDSPSWAVTDPFRAAAADEPQANEPEVASDRAAGEGDGAGPPSIQSDGMPGATRSSATGTPDHGAELTAAAGEDDVLSEAEEFREQLEDRLPHLLASLEDTLGWLLARWETAGPPADPESLAVRVASVRDMLTGLADRLVRPPVLTPGIGGVDPPEPEHGLAV
jgi:hypothetical protein